MATEIRLLSGADFSVRFHLILSAKTSVRDPEIFPLRLFGTFPTSQQKLAVTVGEALLLWKWIPLRSKRFSSCNGFSKSSCEKFHWNGSRHMSACLLSSHDHRAPLRHLRANAQPMKLKFLFIWIFCADLFIVARSLLLSKPDLCQNATNYPE